MSKETPSKVLNEVLAEMRQREQHGLNKYGTTLDRTDLSLAQMLQHAKEEGMDWVMYIQKALRMLAAMEHAQHCGQPELPALVPEGWVMVDKASILSLVAGPANYHHKMNERQEEFARGFDRCREQTIGRIELYFATRAAMLSAAPAAPAARVGADEFAVVDPATLNDLRTTLTRAAFLAMDANPEQWMRMRCTMRRAGDAYELDVMQVSRADGSNVPADILDDALRAYSLAAFEYATEYKAGPGDTSHKYAMRAALVSVGALPSDHVRNVVEQYIAARDEMHNAERHANKLCIKLKHSDACVQRYRDACVALSNLTAHI